MDTIALQDEVLYDTGSESSDKIAEKEEQDIEPYDDTHWVDGPPTKAIEAAMELVSQCWSPEYMMAEFLTQSEIHGEVAEGSRPLQKSSIDQLLESLNGYRQSHDAARQTFQRVFPQSQDATRSSFHRVFSNSSSTVSTNLRALCAAAIGFGCNSAQEWRAKAIELGRKNALPLFLKAFTDLCDLILPAARHIFQTLSVFEEIVKPTETTAPLSLALRAVLNGIAGILLGTGLGEPHNLNRSNEHAYLIDQINAHDASADTDCFTLVVTLIRDCPAAPSLLPGKKLVLLAHILVSATCGPVDIKPAVWQPGYKRSSRWIGDGVAEQYITSVLHSSGSCSRMRFLTADLLRACHYHYLQKGLAALKRDSSATISGTSLADEESNFRGIPRPIREGLAVLAAHLAEAMMKRKNGDLVSMDDVDKTAAVSCAVLQHCDDDKVPSLPDLYIADPREALSLVPEFPPREDEHLQPPQSMCTGTPPPSEWHAAKNPSRGAREDEPTNEPVELLFRRLRPILAGVIVGLFKLFLASLPGENESNNKAHTALPEHEAASYGASNASEITRLRNTTIKCVTGFLLHIIKLFSLHSPMQAEVVLQNMADSNGLLLLLKYLHQNSVHLLTGVPGVGETGWDEAIEVPCPLPLHDGAHVPWGSAPNIQETLPNMCRCILVLDVDQGVIQCDARNLLTCATVLHLIRKLVRRHPSRLALMLFYKMHILVRRKLRVIHPLMTLYGLKLLSDLNPHMGRKWRTQNIKALSQLYRYVTPAIPDTCAASFANIEPYDPSTELPVHPEQKDIESHIHHVVHEFCNIEYPSLRSGW
ncbi:Striatin-interacting protein-like protein [Diplonema papillatum]|nr:Striatin-interacting protein-like protein [Diplonema papillatum]